MHSVFITSVIPKNGIDLLSKKGFQVTMWDKPRSVTKHELLEIVSKYDAMITLVNDKINQDVLSHASPSLKIISNYAVGYDNIDVPYAKSRGIVVTNTPGVANESVAEHTFALILACAKRLIEADRFTRQGKYTHWNPMLFVTPQIWGRTIGIVGLGKIGTFVGQIAYGGFRMKILYHDVIRSEDFEMLTDAQFVKLPALLRESDVVTIHAPLTPTTRHLIGKEELKLMKETALLVNTARGAIIDEEALVWALSHKQIAAAGIDVFEHEPLVPQTLRVLSNVILTPHIASATLETREDMARIAACNIIDVFGGKTPAGLISVS